MGAPVLCAGRARYTQLPTTFFPGSQQAYREKLAELLVSEHIDVPQEFTRNAKMFLHYELYRASLDLSEFLRPYPDQAGMTLLTDFDPADLERSLAIRVIRDGILFTKPFVYPRMT
jgi:FMN phosphatase YigB (HAD superfamily)